MPTTQSTNSRAEDKKKQQRNGTKTPNNIQPPPQQSAPTQGRRQSDRLLWRTDSLPSTIKESLEKHKNLELTTGDNTVTMKQKEQAENKQKLDD